MLDCTNSSDRIVSILCQTSPRQNYQNAPSKIDAWLLHVTRTFKNFQNYIENLIKFCSLLSWFWKWMLVGRYHHLWFFPGVTILSSWLVCKSYTSSLDFRSSLDFESSLDFQFNFYFYSLQNYFELSKLINRIFRM